MKCTTKILIGILLSGLVVVMVGTILNFTLGHRRDRWQFVGESTQVEVAPYRVVNVWIQDEEQLKKEEIYVNGYLALLPAVDGRRTLSYPKDMEHYLFMETKNDTLNLIFKITAHNLPDEYKDKERVGLSIAQMTLMADSSLVAVCSRVEGLNIQLSKLKLDSVTLRASYLEVDSCDLRSLAVDDTWQLRLRNSRIHNVYLDLDRVPNWSVSACQLENEYLTGSRNHYNNLQKDECRRMYWKPKSEEAELTVRLKSEACVSLLNESESLD